MQDNLLLIDKPAGWTSFDVVAKIRGIRRQQLLEVARGGEGKGAAGATDLFRTPRDEGKPSVVPHVTKRQLRVGHAGTLDPFATGLLIILLGDGTKKAGEFLKLDKTYEATFVLGSASTTGDPEGEITKLSGKIPTRDKVERTLQKFTGTITQIPPAYSAIKVGGQRAYKLARAGKRVDIPAREVTIYTLELLSYEYPELKIRTHVSSGTYIRTLAEDIGAALGTSA
ncbi:MAG TPA: tRNA pseudouridine(55) synthase TruB, partial [Candidatus Saccharimonadaceae bacterium]|nr:tRNA pseudouridine(55) synthase TruB [Candidatus Saccharimonadaceae bacterium]